jgi:hypothetical protein
MTSRWLRVAERHDNLWRSHRAAYYWVFRVPSIVLAATVPVLVSLNVNRSVTALLALALASLTALDGFFRYGLRWQQQRRAAADNEFEGWRFIELSGPEYSKHTSHQEVYKLFLTRIENTNERLATTYLDLFNEDQRASRGE